MSKPYELKNPLQITIRVTIGPQNSGYGGIELSESYLIPSIGFDGVASLMKRFYELSETIKAEQARNG